MANKEIKKEVKMVEEKTWKEFRDNGFVWLINTTLHMFGWAIVYESKDGEITKVYPARVKFRGFSDEINSAGYKKVSDYMVANAEVLAKEANE